MVQRGGFCGVCVSQQGVSLADGPVVASLRRMLMFGFTAGSFGVELLWYSTVYSCV